MKNIFSIGFFVIFGFFMIVAILHLSPVGDPRLPSYAGYINPDIPVESIPKESQSVGLYYNKNGYIDSHTISAVGAMILDYRGYDTLYETTVLFTALISVLSVLVFGAKKGFVLSKEWESSIIIRNICRRMVPFIFLFGIYIILHGHLSPGGGFQGGVVVGSAFIIYTVIFGLEEGQHYVPEDVLKITDSLGGMIYASIGILGIILGYSFLANKIASIPPVGEPGIFLSSGTLIGINIGIGMHVASTMIGMFFGFQQEGENNVDQNHS